MPGLDFLGGSPQDTNIEDLLRNELAMRGSFVGQLGEGLKRMGQTIQGNPDPGSQFLDERLKLQQALAGMKNQRLDRIEKGLGILGTLSKSELDDETVQKLGTALISSMGLPPSLADGLKRNRQTLAISGDPEFLQHLGVSNENIAVSVGRGAKADDVFKQVSRIARPIFQKDMNEEIAAGRPKEQAAQAVLEKYPGFASYMQDWGLSTPQATPAMMESQRHEQIIASDLPVLQALIKSKKITVEDAIAHLASKGITTGKDLFPVTLKGAEAAAGVTGAAQGEITPITPGGPTAQQIGVQTAGAKAGAESMARLPAEKQLIAERAKVGVGDELNALAQSGPFSLPTFSAGTPAQKSQMLSAQQERHILTAAAQGREAQQERPLEPTERERLSSLIRANNILETIATEFTPAERAKFVGAGGARFKSEQIAQLYQDVTGGKVDRRFADFAAINAEGKREAFATGGKQLTPYEATVVWGFVPTGTELSVEQYESKLKLARSRTNQLLQTDLTLASTPRSNLKQTLQELKKSAMPEAERELTPEEKAAQFWRGR